MDIIIVGAMLLMGLLGAAIGIYRNRPLAGFLFGALLGPIGWFIVFIGPTVPLKKRARPGNW